MPNPIENPYSWPVDPPISQCIRGKGKQIKRVQGPQQMQQFGHYVIQLVVSIHLKHNISQKCESSPSRGENSKHLKPPPSHEESNLTCNQKDLPIISVARGPDLFSKISSIAQIQATRLQEETEHVVCTARLEQGTSSINQHGNGCFRK